MKIEEYFMRIAVATSLRSTCKKASVGAIIVKHGNIIATGYNGSASKSPHCVHQGCLLDDHGHCIRTVHAEVNAIINAAKNGSRTYGGTMYCTHRPCFNCTKAIVNSGIVSVVFLNEYDSGTLADQCLLNAEIPINQFKGNLK